MYIAPGNLVFGDVFIKSTKDKYPQTIQLYTAIKDFNGHIYDSKEEDVELTSSLYLNRNLSIPSEALSGEYLFYARATKDNKISIKFSSGE